MIIVNRLVILRGKMWLVLFKNILLFNLVSFIGYFGLVYFIYFYKVIEKSYVVGVNISLILCVVCCDFFYFWLVYF